MMVHVASIVLTYKCEKVQAEQEEFGKMRGAWLLFVSHR